MVRVRGNSNSDKNHRTRKYAAASFPMLVLAIGSTAMLMGDRALLSGLAPPLESVPSQKSKKSSSVINEEYDKRLKRWFKHSKDMPICNHVKAVCSDNGLLPRLRASVAAGSKMRASVMGIGGGPLSYIALLCAVIGIYLSDILSKLTGKGDKKHESGGRGATIARWWSDRLRRLTGKQKHDKEDGTTMPTSNAQYQTIKNKTSDIEDGIATTNRSVRFQAIKNKMSDVDDGTTTITQSNQNTTSSVEDQPSSLYRPEAEATDGQDGLESPAVPSVVKTMSHNAMTYLSGTSFSWTNPVVTYKIFIALLLVIELNDLMAPEQTVMYTPEIIALQRAKPDPREYVPYMADYLTPSLSYATADMWYRRLKIVRNVLIISWLTYLVLPPKRIGGVCYVVGALLYCYLATIGLMYNLGHSMQGGILFILCSILAVPFLGCPKYGDRSARWLRRFLYIGVLIPIYLFSGVSKFRYKGFWPQWTGSWMTSAFTRKGIRRSVYPELYTFIRTHNWAMALFSWGNVVVEYLLPLAMLLWIENPILQALFHVSSILFHISVFVLMGPNFIRYCLMHMLAWNPLNWFGWKPQRPSSSTTEGTSASIGPITWLDKVRAGFTFYTMFGWFYVQYNSDIEHLRGNIDRMERANPYFPIPELSMFAKPKHPNFTCAFILVSISLACYLLVMFTRWSLDRDSTSTDFFYWLPFYNHNERNKQYFKGTMVIPLDEEEMALAKKQGKTFVVFEGTSVSSLPRRNGESPVLYEVSQDEE